MNYGMQPAGGRHLASRRAKGPSGWVLAPGVLALVALVLFILALMGNLGPERLTGDGTSGQAAPDTRPAQALPADGEQAQPAEQPAEEEQAQEPAQDPALEPAAAAVDLVGIAKLDGEQLGDIATYDDGLMACVNRTRHEDAGQGLAKVVITTKMVNAGDAPVDASTTLVELAFARESSRATLIDGERLGVIEPGGEAVAEWSFRMPLDQIDDISVTMSPSDGHEKVKFHGASR